MFPFGCGERERRGGQIEPGAKPRNLERWLNLGQGAPTGLEIRAQRREPFRSRTKDNHAELVRRAQRRDLGREPRLHRLGAPGGLHAVGVVDHHHDRAARHGVLERPERTRKRPDEEQDDQAAQEKCEPAPDAVTPRIAQCIAPEKTQRRKRDPPARLQPQHMQQRRQSDQSRRPEKSRQEEVHQARALRRAR